MFAAIALIVGAVVLWRLRGPQKQVWLMLVAAAVMIADVLIWLLPGPGSG